MLHSAFDGSIANARQARALLERLGMQYTDASIEWDTGRTDFYWISFAPLLSSTKPTAAPKV
jgi:hypothetical protein